MIHKVQVAGSGLLEASSIQAWLSAIPGVQRVDVNTAKRLVRVIGDGRVTQTAVAAVCQAHQLKVAFLPYGNGMQTEMLTVDIAGMHCRSCELLVEREFGQLPGVQKVSVNADRGKAQLVCAVGQAPNEQAFAAVITKHGYHVRGVEGASSVQELQRPNVGHLAGIFALVLVVGYAFSRLGWLQFTGSVGTATSFSAVFIIGLVAASSSCIAVSGGLMLSVVANFRERYHMHGAGRLVPTASFVVGRIIGYTVLGGLIAGIGKALSPSPLATGIITIIAALYMLIMGLDMLHLAPGWLRAVLPRMPKALGHRVLEGSTNVRWFSPFLLGALTFFLPCGFTQALQLYVLTTGNVVTGAVTMFAFALGTAPALLALGWASNALKGKAGQFFFKLAGATVIVLGLYNVSNGLAITGLTVTNPFASTKTVQNADANVTFNGTTQFVRTRFTDAGYEPATFTVRAGIPVQWEVDAAGQAGGCRAVFQVPAFKISQLLSDSAQTFTFTPDKPGTYAFSCGMGMYRSSFTVVSS